MPILISFHEETPTRARVYRFHHKPHKLPQEQIDAGILLDSEDDIPTPNPLPDEQGVLFANPQTGELWWEYEPKQFSPEELAQQQMEVLDALLGGLEDE